MNVVPFPVLAKFSADQARELRHKHDAALLDLLSKPARSAFNLQRQLKLIVPASSHHAIGPTINDLISDLENIIGTLEDLQVGLARVCLETKRRDPAQTGDRADG